MQDQDTGPLCFLEVPGALWGGCGSSRSLHAALQCPLVSGSSLDLNSTEEHSAFPGASLVWWNDYFCGTAQFSQAFLAHTTLVDVSSPSPQNGTWKAHLTLCCKAVLAQ